MNIVKSDKSNKIVIIDSIQYNEKMKKCIDKLGCKRLKKNPLESLIKEIKLIIKDDNWSEEIKNSLYIKSNAIIPKIFGIIKDHKVDMPIRPVVAKCSGPMYILEKVMKNILTSYLPDSNFVISSTNEFLHRIKNFQIQPNELMMSLDITSLYPSVNIESVKKKIDECLDNSANTQDIKSLLKRSIKIILESNFFEYNGTFFQQTKGAPMGSPMSGVLAEFILRPLEETIISNHNEHIKLWTRYVDDVFLVFNTEYNFEDFLNEINLLDNDIKFTFEKETNSRLNYLDVSILKRKNGTLLLDVYRKPMASRAVIPRGAAAPWSHKLAAFRSMINRKNNICSNIYKNREFKRILDIAKKSGYDRKTIIKLDNKIRRKNENNQQDKNEKEKFAGSLEYHEGLSENIGKILRKHKLKIGINTRLKMFNIIRKDRIPIKEEDKNGIYNIPIVLENGERSNYVGLTKRKMKIRKKEHIADIVHNRKTTALSKLNNTERIHIEFENMKIIYPYTNQMGTAIQESIAILHHHEKVCNDGISQYLPVIWNDILGNRNKKKNINPNIIQTNLPENEVT